LSLGIEEGYWANGADTPPRGREDRVSWLPVPAAARRDTSVHDRVLVEAREISVHKIDPRAGRVNAGRPRAGAAPRRGR